MASVELVPWFLKWGKSRGSSGPMGPIAGHGWILATKSPFRGRRSARIERGTEKHPVAAICTAHHGCPGAVLSSFVACAPACFGALASCEAMKAMMKRGAWSCPQNRREWGEQRWNKKDPTPALHSPTQVFMSPTAAPPPKPPIRALVSASCRPSDDGPCPFCHFHPIPLRFTFGPTGPIRQHRHNPR